MATVLAYASNGSAEPIQRRPKTMAPSTMITSQPRAQTRSTGSVVRSGCTSSSQANPNSAAAAGQTPIRRGSLASPCPGSTRARAQRPAWMVRSGFVARQNRPNSSEIGTSPTQTQTKANPKTGLVSRSCPADQRQSRPGPGGEDEQPGGDAYAGVVDHLGQGGPWAAHVPR